MSRRATAALHAAVVLVVALASLAAIAPVNASIGGTHTLPDGPAALDDRPRATTGEELPPANATIEIRLRPNGDARWTVSTWFNLTNESDREAFGEIADRFEAGETSDLGLTAFRRELADVRGATGREMEIRDEEFTSASDAAVERGTGRLSLTFTWTNFARTGPNGTLAVGDAFNTTDGTLLSGLAANQSLVIVPPRDYNVYESTVPATQGTLRWEGPRSFGPDTLRATFTGDGVATPTEPGPQESRSPSTVLIGGILAVLALAMGGVYLVARRSNVRWGGSDDGGTATLAEPADGSDPGAAADPSTADDDDAGVDVELLSDEERVEHLLERNGGRMKQATIVKETGWSNAKVSQLLSSMADDDRIDKLRIGRENLISFPDEDVGDIED